MKEGLEGVVGRNRCDSHGSANGRGEIKSVSGRRGLRKGCLAGEAEDAEDVGR